MDNNCQAYTLSECVDQLLIARQISKKKYYASYLNIAKNSWQKIFRNTIWAVQSRWMTLKDGDPYPYVDVPPMASRILSVAVDCNSHGHHHTPLIQPLFYNSQLNILAKPKQKKCGCKHDCNCGDCCESVNSMSYTTTFLFSINGIDYYQKCWTKVCKNGDIIEYCETPTKKYNTTTGDSGDFNEDYNDDYLHSHPPFTDFTIENVITQRKICSLEVLPCGCPKDTPENQELIVTHCGCQLNFDGGCRKRHCKQYDENINNNHYGEVKLSDCGTKIFFRPSSHWRRFNDKKFPEFLLVNFQTNGLNIDSEVLVPDYALSAMMATINWESMRFNPALSRLVKDDAFYQSEMENDRLVAFMNPISVIEVGKVQDVAVKW